MKRDEAARRAASAWRSRVPGMRSQSFAPRLPSLRIPLPKKAEDLAPMVERLVGRVPLEDLLATGVAALETHAQRLKEHPGHLGRHHATAQRLAKAAKNLRAPDLSGLGFKGPRKPDRKPDAPKKPASKTPPKKTNKAPKPKPKPGADAKTPAKDVKDKK